MEVNVELNVPRYVSAEKYSELTGLGLIEVKSLCKSQKIVGAYISEGGHYKIPVYNNVVPKEAYEEVKKENTALKEKLKSIFLIAEGGEKNGIRQIF